MLVDGGQTSADPPPKGKYGNRAANYISNVLGATKSEKDPPVASRLDRLLITHWEDDHYKGVVKMFTNSDGSAIIRAKDNVNDIKR